MQRSVRFAVVCVAVSLLVSCRPVEAWYKQSTGPSYYSVGRASGLLSGIRRSPYVRRSESEETLVDSGETVGNSDRQISILKSMVSGGEMEADLHPINTVSGGEIEADWVLLSRMERRTRA